MAEKAAPEQNTDTIKLAISLTPNGGGDETTVEFQMTYPKDNGLALLDAMNHLGKYVPSLGVTLAEKGDPSIAAAMAEAGVTLDDTDENEQNEETQP